MLLNDIQYNNFIPLLENVKRSGLEIALMSKSVPTCNVSLLLQFSFSLTLVFLTQLAIAVLGFFYSDQVLFLHFLGSGTAPTAWSLSSSYSLSVLSSCLRSLRC